MSTSTVLSGNLVSMRDTFGAFLPELGEKYPKIIVLDADLSMSTRTGAFAKKFPHRSLNVGIAEQNLVGFAAGIAIDGGIPFVNTFASFLTRRAADQIAISVAYTNLNVKFFGFHGGINLGEDGATQQAVEDLGIMRTIPGIRVYTPIDAENLKAIMREVVTVNGPTYVRLSRFPSAIVSDKEGAEKGFQILRKGKGSTVFALGIAVSEALSAAEALTESGLDPRVVAVSRLKPLPEEILDLFEPKKPIECACLEEHNVIGGLADALSLLFDQAEFPHRIHRIGVPDRFGESGPPRALLEKFQLAGQPLIKKLKEVMKK